MIELTGRPDNDLETIGGKIMPTYQVTYNSMTANYGPSFIEANSEDEARRKFKGTAFSDGEFQLIRAREVSPREIARALRARRDNE